VNWLELAKLAASLVTPLVVVLLGFQVNKRLKSIDEAQWQGRKLIEKRIALYDQIAPDLNKMYCFCRWVGYWKEISPRDMITAKRDLDKLVNIYRALLTEDFYRAYNDFIHVIYRPYAGRNHDARIRSEISNQMGDRRSALTQGWDPAYDALFDTTEVADFVVLERAYARVMQSLQRSIGLDLG